MTTDAATANTANTALQLPPNLPPAFQAMIDDLHTMTADKDNLSITIDIAEGILSGKSIDEIIDAGNGDTVSGETFTGRPFPIAHDAISFQASADQYKDEGGFPFYAIVRTVDENDGNKPIVLACGGSSVVPTIYAFWKSGLLKDKTERFVLKTTVTSSGWDLLKLFRADAAKKG